MMSLAYKRHPKAHLTASGVALPRIDGRTIAGKRYRELIAEYTAEAGGGVLAPPVAGLVRQAATLRLRIEQIELLIATNKPVDDDALIRLTGELRRVLESLRAQATKSKPATPSLADYLAAKQAEKAAGAPDGGAA